MVVLGAGKVSCLESSEVEMRARVVLGVEKVSCLEVSSVQGHLFVERSQLMLFIQHTKENYRTAQQFRNMLTDFCIIQ